MVHCFLADIFSPVGDFVGITSDSTKPGIVWEGGDHEHGSSVPYSLYLSICLGKLR
jgi:hypothetical protein